MRALLCAMPMLALAGCAAAPSRDAPVCEASKIHREAPQESQGQRGRLIALATAEWERFGSPIVRLPRDATDARQLRGGVREDGSVVDDAGQPEAGVRAPEAADWVRRYWRAIGWSVGDVSADSAPWSAAFVSWAMINAGAGPPDFCGHAAHSGYLHWIDARASGDAQARLVLRPLAEYAPRPGDLICAARANSGLSIGVYRTIRADGRPTHRSGHCDIVVSVGPGFVNAIGGNVRDAVTMTEIPTDETGRVIAGPARPWFAVVENRYP